MVVGPLSAPQCSTGVEFDSGETPTSGTVGLRLQTEAPFPFCVAQHIGPWVSGGTPRCSVEDSDGLKVVVKEGCA